jgi:hypothetical protein
MKYIYKVKLFLKDMVDKNIILTILKKSPSEIREAYINFCTFHFNTSKKQEEDKMRLFSEEENKSIMRLSILAVILIGILNIILDFTLKTLILVLIILLIFTISITFEKYKLFKLTKNLFNKNWRLNSNLNFDEIHSIQLINIFEQILKKVKLTEDEKRYIESSLEKEEESFTDSWNEYTEKAK